MSNSKQFEFSIENKVTGNKDQARATAKNAYIAREAISNYYGDRYHISEDPCTIREPHAIVGEVDCM